MAKHVIEEQLLNGAGFNTVSNGETEFISQNTDRTIEFGTDGTIDIDIKDNKMLFKAKTPVFTTTQW